MTREERCRTAEDGEPCEYALVYMGRTRECALIVNCHGRPCASAYEQALRTRESCCPRADGDQWQDCERPPGPPPRPPSVHARAAACLACPAHSRRVARWVCAVLGEEVNARLMDSRASCPADPPRWGPIAMD